MQKTILYLLALVLLGNTKQNEMPCNDSIFLQYRNTSFQAFGITERKYYQDKRDACGDTVVCADNNVQELFKKKVSEMSDEEYAIFQDIIKDCKNVNVCSLYQFEEILKYDQNKLNINEKDLWDYCTSECDKYGKLNCPEKCQKKKKRRIIALITGGLILASFGCFTLLWYPGQGYK